jgi:transketolase
MRRQFKDSALRLAAQDEKLTLLFGDISVFLFKDFWDKYPDRFFNAGICESTLVSMAAGLSAAGWRPVVHTIAPFVTERCYEQIKLDVCYNGFPVCIVSCGASFDYAWDGATHHCYTDLELMRMLPGMAVAQPGSPKEFDILFEAYRKETSYIRMSDDAHKLSLDVKPGKGAIVRETPGAKLTVATAGPLLGNVAEACAGLPVNILYFPTIKPLDTELLARFSKTKILVVHDAFGLFEALAGAMPLSLEYHGIPDRFCCFYGTLQDIRKTLALDPSGIRERVASALKNSQAAE